MRLEDNTPFGAFPPDTSFAVGARALTTVHSRISALLFFLVR